MTDSRALLRSLDEHITETPALNPMLYSRLSARFGSVIVARQGEPMFGGGYEYDGTRTRYRPLCNGEYYRICCPFCLRRNAVDTKHRLWINHRWGIGLDPDNEFYDPNDRFWWAAVCYNEDCLRDPDNVKELRRICYSGVGRELHREEVKILPGTADRASLGLVQLPGTCQRVDTMDQSHHAYQYLITRGLDPVRIGKDYDVHFCFEAYDFPVATGKLVIPIYMNGKMVSWQARPPYDLDWKAAGQPKYYNCPGTNKRLMVYGVRQARDLPFCIVTEGVTDVWKIGPGSLSIFGKTMSSQQALFIAKGWPVVVLALDPDAQKETVRTKNLLEESGTRVATVQMPEGLDPASIDTNYFWDLVHRSCTEQGVEILP